MFICGLCEEKIHEPPAAHCCCHNANFCEWCVDYTFENQVDATLGGCPMDGWTQEPLELFIEMPVGTMPFIPGPPYVH